MSLQQLDVRTLYNTLDVVRAHNDMTWRDLAKVTGVSPSTFSRMAAGHRPDVDALCTLIAWLRVPLDRFVVAATEPNPDAPEVTA
jgi:transcriptional regulator with XRE-family HTH domain